ncbi:fungal-specific transcription factor domain-containing protein [Spinellus fusiger]|nr:fungal-specific transcription factor domain-containing protein [Spinellus fusiger]
MFSGMATRMALELGLNREETVAGNGLTKEMWIQQELRRRVFWTVFSTDKLTCAATGRPSALQEEDCTCFLPGDEQGWSREKIYNESLNGSKVQCLNVQKMKESHLMGVLPSGYREVKPELTLHARFLRLTALLSKVTTFINRRRESTSNVPLYHPDSECTEIEQKIEAWYWDLPPSKTNTPENIKQIDLGPPADKVMFVTSHMLYNVLIIFLHRPSLVALETMPPDLQPDHVVYLHGSISKCLMAVHSLTQLIGTIGDSIKLMPGYLSYFTYIAATIAITNIFSVKVEECSKARQDLAVHFSLLESLRLYWAISDRLFFMIGDLYAMHTNTLLRPSTQPDPIGKQVVYWNDEFRPLPGHCSKKNLIHIEPTHPSPLHSSNPSNYSMVSAGHIEAHAPNRQPVEIRSLLTKNANTPVHWTLPETGANGNFNGNTTHTIPSSTSAVEISPQLLQRDGPGRIEHQFPNPMMMNGWPLDFFPESTQDSYLDKHDYL